MTCADRGPGRAHGEKRENRTRGVPRGYHFLPEAERRRRLAALEKYPNDTAAARALGLRANALTRWRVMHGIRGKLGPGKGWTLPPGEEAARRQMYDDGLSDAEASEKLGIAVGAFSSWRFYHGLRGKKDPGPRKPSRLSRSQNRLLAYLRDHPWNTCEKITIELQVPFATNVRDSMLRLAKRGLVACCLHERAKKYALTGTQMPEKAMAFRPDFPNPYYRRVSLRPDILRVLGARSWLMRSELVEAIGAGVTDPQVQYATRIMVQRGELQSRLHRMPNGYVRLWALKDAPGFRGPHSVRVQKAFTARTGKGAVPRALEDFVRRHPWSTVQEVAAGIKRPYTTVVHWTPILEKRGVLQRVLVNDLSKGSFDHGLPTHRQIWAVSGVKPPEDGVDSQMFSSRRVAQAKIALLVHDHPGVTAADLTAAYRAKYGKGTYAWICHNLDALASVGIVSVARRGPAAGRWTANGSASELVAEQARAHVDLIERHARKLRALGFMVMFEVSPPEEKEVGP